MVDAQVKANMKAVLDDIRNGAFAERFIQDQDQGATEFKALREQEAGHQIEATGKQLRQMFSWLKSSDDDYVEGSAAR